MFYSSTKYFTNKINLLEIELYFEIAKMCQVSSFKFPVSLLIQILYLKSYSNNGFR